jgi:hypothetical protein
MRGSAINDGASEMLLDFSSAAAMESKSSSFHAAMVSTSCGWAHTQASGLVTTSVSICAGAR